MKAALIHKFMMFNVFPNFYVVSCPLKTISFKCKLIIVHEGMQTFDFCMDTNDLNQGWIFFVLHLPLRSLDVRFCAVSF